MSVKRGYLQSMTRFLQPRSRKHTLNWLQQRVVQPATTALGSSAVALQTLLHERRSSLQTRRLWLPGEQADWVRFNDCKGWPVCA